MQGYNNNQMQGGPQFMPQNMNSNNNQNLGGAGGNGVNNGNGMMSGGGGYTNYNSGGYNGGQQQFNSTRNNYQQQQQQQGMMMANQQGGGGPNRGGFRGGNGNFSVNNGQGQMNQQQQPRTADATQPRNNEVGDASTVIHLRNVTPEVSQLSIQNTIQSFGRIRNIVMLRQKNQALVEMESVNAAQQLVEFFKDPGYVEIDGRRVYVRYSLHTELTAAQHTSKTLLVSMFNTQYDVSAAAQITATIVYQIFGNYGAVERIVVLPKNDSSAQNHNRVQALVQFDTKETASNVKNILQGQPVTLGETITFTLDIQFSRMEEIKTSSPHNSLVIPKPGSAPVPPSQIQQNEQTQQQTLGTEEPTQQS